MRIWEKEPLALDNNRKFHYNIIRYRGMAKFGIALGSGPRGLGFESRYSDQEKSPFCLLTKGTFFN